MTGTLAIFAALSFALLLAHVRVHHRTRRIVSWVALYDGLEGPSSSPRRPTLSLRDPRGFQWRMLALALAGIAFVRTRTETGGGGDTIFIVDTSASMATREGPAQTRLQIAHRWIRQATRSMSADDRLAIITAGSAAEILLPWTRDPMAVSVALAPLVAEGGPAAVVPAIALAETIVRPRPTKVVLLSDGVGVKLPPHALDLGWQPIGSARPDTAVLELTASRLDAFGTTLVSVEVGHEGAGSADVPLELWAAHRLIDVVVLDLPAHERITWSRAYPLGRDGLRIDARLEAPPDDARADDDVLSVHVPAMRPVRVRWDRSSTSPAWQDALDLHPAVVSVGQEEGDLAPDLVIPLAATDLDAPGEEPPAAIAARVIALVDAARPAEPIVRGTPPDPPESISRLGPPAVLSPAAMAEPPTRPPALPSTLGSWLAWLAALVLVSDHLRPFAPQLRQGLRERRLRIVRMIRPRVMALARRLEPRRPTPP